MILDELRHLLSLVNEWLRFAEAKNGVLFGANAGLAFSYLGFLAGDIPFENCWVNLYISNGVILFALSAIVALLSFLPSLEIPKKNSENIIGIDNPLFFGHLRRYTHDSLIQLLSEEMEAKPSKLEKYYSEQIVVNSEIAWRKYQFFNAATVMMLSGILSPFVVALFYVIKKRFFSKRDCAQLNEGDL